MELEPRSEVYRRQVEDARRRIREEWPEWMRRNLTHPEARRAAGLPERPQSSARRQETETA